MDINSKKTETGRKKYAIMRYMVSRIKRDAENRHPFLSCLSAAKSAAFCAAARAGHTDALGTAFALGIVAALLCVALDRSTAGGTSSCAVGRCSTLTLLVGSAVGAGAYMDSLKTAASHLIMGTGSYLTFQICHLIPSFLLETIQRILRRTSLLWIIFSFVRFVYAFRTVFL